MSQLKLSNVATPASPPAGKVTLFANGDDLYYKDSSGTVTGPLGSGGGSGGDSFFFSIADKLIEASGSLILSESLAANFLSSSYGAEITGSILFNLLGPSFSFVISGSSNGVPYLDIVDTSLPPSPYSYMTVDPLNGGVKINNQDPAVYAQIDPLAPPAGNADLKLVSGSQSIELYSNAYGTQPSIRLTPDDSRLTGSIIVRSAFENPARLDVSVSSMRIEDSLSPPVSVPSDTYFFVSGAIGSKDGADPGVSAFGGDVHVSGNISVDGNASITDFVSVGQNIQVVGLMGITGSAQFLGGITGSFTGTMTGSLTQLTDGTSYLVAGTNIEITSESNGQVTIATVPGLSIGQFWQSDVTGSIYATGSIFAYLDITGSNLLLDDSESRILAPNGALVISSSAGTFITGSLIVSGARSDLGTESTSVLFNGDIFVSGGIGINDYIQLKPVNELRIPTNTTSSYIYTSGSTNDLYFTQYNGPYTNTTRLRWLESTLSTGLLHGGILSTQNGTTTFSITSGSGLVVSYNASTTTDPYPTIKFVGWPAYVSQSLTYSGSAQISYIGINDSGGIIQRATPFDAIDYETYIPIGRILHQSGSVTNGTITSPHVSYGLPGSHDIFVRAFGPLKLSGHVLAASGSSPTLSLTKTGGDSYVEGRNYTTNPSSPDLVLSTTDFALTGSKIYREHVSGSTPVIDTGVGAAGYTVIDPTKYVDANGILQTVSGGQFTVQRVFWFPNSVNRALFVYYGNTAYNSIESAQAGISDEIFVEGANTVDAAIFVGYVIVRSNASDLFNTAQAKIIQGPLFRAAGKGGGGGGGTTTPGGLDTYVQFNDGGSTFGGVAGLTFNKATNTLATTNLAVSNIATVSGSVILGDATSDVVYVSGSVTASNGLTVTTGSIYADRISGSLTHLTDGTSYLIAGTGIQITTASIGSITISSTGGSGLQVGKQYLAAMTTTTATSALVIGQFSWDPADYPGLSSAKIRAIMSTDGTVNHTGSLQIYNLTSGSYLDLDIPLSSKYFVVTGSTPTLLTSSNLLSGITGFDNTNPYASVYEVRVSGSSANNTVIGGVELVFS